MEFNGFPPVQRRLGPTHWAALTLLCLICALPQLRAHGDLDARIAAAGAEIEKRPDDANLYVLRAELHRLHEQFDLALADLDRAAELAPALADTSFVRGRVYVDLQLSQAALAAFNRHLKRAPDHVEGYVDRARLLRALKQYAAAAEDYASAIAKAKDPLPEYYIERARLLIPAAGDDLATGHAAALECLNAGIEKIGAIVTLELEAIEIETAAGRFDSALKRIDRFLAQTPRQETWLERKGQVLEQAGRKSDAFAAYRAGLAAIEQLSDRVKSTAMIQDLQKRLTAALKRVSEPQPTPAAPTPPEQ